MTLLEGPHVSSDVALVDGEPKWWRHATGLATGEGMFDRWTIHAAANPPLEAACGAWIRKNLEGFTGILNLETIGGTIIEAHLRLSDQWPDLYGRGLDGGFRRPLPRQASGAIRPRPPRRLQHRAVRAVGAALSSSAAGAGAEVAAMPGVSSVQITFHEHKAPERHSMPPGGFRVAIVNAFDLAKGEAAREVLRAHFLGDGPAVNVKRARLSAMMARRCARVLPSWLRRGAMALAARPRRWRCCRARLAQEP